MDVTRQHWKILQQVDKDLVDRIRLFLVIGREGDGLVMATKDGETFWYGRMQFGKESIQVTTPTRLDVSSLIKMAHGGDHIVLLNEQGEIYTMGRNEFGQLGQGTVDEESHFSPQLIASPDRFISVRCGKDHSLALTDDGKVYGWGKNGWHQIANTTSNVPSLHQLSELDCHRVVAIDCGYYHSLALTDQGEVYAWGNNSYGQLGITNRSYLSSPIRMSSPSSIKSIAAGHSHNLILTLNGEVFACGSNKFGQLGLPVSTKEFNACFWKIPGLPTISEIASHFASDLSIVMSNSRECFVFGYLGNGVKNSTPLKLPPIYSTIESAFSFSSAVFNTPYSIRIKAWQYSTTTDSDKQTEPQHVSSPLLDRISQMFDNQDSDPDLQFVLGEKFILAHRNVLHISGQFSSLLSNCSSSVDIIPVTSTITLPQSDSITPHRHTTNPSNFDPQSSKIIQISIPNHSYLTFYAYLRFLYTGIFEISTENIPELFELSHIYKFPELQKLCLSRMLANLSLETCCQYYELADRYRLVQLESELVRFIADQGFKVFGTKEYTSMDSELSKKLTLAIWKYSQTD